MNIRATWDALYPGVQWPGLLAAVKELADEVQSLRLLTDELVTVAVKDEAARRSTAAIQGAHDIVGQYCVEADDRETFKYVSALCWVLRHDHNGTFGQIIATVESDIERMGLQVVQLRDPVDPVKGGRTQ